MSACRTSRCSVTELTFEEFDSLPDETCRETEALHELNELLGDIRRGAEEMGYGFFPGGDPNDFTPDPECSTAEEQERHREACAAYRSGKGNPHPAPHCATMNGGVAAKGFGLGTYTYRDEQAADWAERLERCIARLT